MSKGTNNQDVASYSEMDHSMRLLTTLIHLNDPGSPYVKTRGEMVNVREKEASFRNDTNRK